MCTWGAVEQVVECCNEGTTCKSNAVLCNHDKGSLLDYGNMWGAGIGFDFNASDVDLTRERWDAEAAHIKGVSFDLDPLMDPSLIRVGFPMLLSDDTPLPAGKGAVLREGAVIRDGSVSWPDGTALSDKGELEDDRTITHNADQRVDSLPAGSTSEEYPGGSPFWKPDENEFPVSAGHNQIFWDQVASPTDTNYGEFSATRLMGIQFQVRTSNETNQPFHFCVGNFSFLR